MPTIKPDGESRPGLISTRDCRLAFRIDDRNLRRAINTGRLPIYIVNEKRAFRRYCRRRRKATRES
jgi:hypothetical protein